MRLIRLEIAVAFLKELLRKITASTEELADEVAGHLWHGTPVIRVARGEFEGQQLPPVVDHERKLTAKMPTPGVFAQSHQVLKHLVRLGSAGMANLKRGGVNEGNPGHFTRASVRVS
jgi:hypothetical protein